MIARRAAGRLGHHVQSAIVTHAPGRVNIIGGHTDYNGGLVLPIAVDVGTYITAFRRGDSICRIFSANFEEQVSVDLQGLSPRGAWSDYVAGVALGLKERQLDICGLDMYIHSTVPVGGGLSSSAALEVAACLAWEAAAGSQLHARERALLCQEAENDFVGMQCGLMDQLVACTASEGYAARITFSGVSVTDVPLPDSIRFIVCNTNKHRDLTGTTYNEIRDECEQAAEQMGVQTLSELSEESLQQARKELTESQFFRTRHVVTENTRVRRASDALAEGDAKTCGRLLNESHASLRDDYRVSCPELEAMHQACNSLNGCFGARLVGGGFGGCVLALVAGDVNEEMIGRVARDYTDATGIEPTMLAVNSAGHGVVIASG